MNDKSANQGKYKKILVIRFSSLGDIILTTPLLKILKENFPDSKIDYCTKEEYREILCLNPNLNKIITVGEDFDFKRLKLLKDTLKQHEYDLIIDAHNNLRTFYLRQFLTFGSKVLKFKKYSFRKFMLVKFKINLMKNPPTISERYVEIVAKITDGKPARHLPEIITDQSSKQKIDNILKELGIKNKIIAIAPASKHFTKTYPAELYSELINKISKDYSIALVGKGNDIMAIQRIMENAGDNVINLCSRLSVTELAELFKRSSLFIGGDTGPMHIAEAVNVPIIMLAGSSVKEFGFYPQSDKSFIIENNNLNCRPCSHIGRSSCPKGHFKCMVDLKPADILKVVQIELLN